MARRRAFLYCLAIGFGCGGETDETTSNADESASSESGADESGAGGSSESAGDGDDTSGDGDDTSGDGDASSGDGDGSSGDGDGSSGDGDGSSGDGDGSSGDGDGSSGDGSSGDGDGSSGDGDGSSGDGSSGDGDGSTGDGDGTTGDGDGDGSVGCGTTQSAGATTRSLTVNNTSRDYIVVIPPGYDPTQAYPLVFAWHGLGGDGALARLYYGIEQASAGAAIFVYPDGLPQASQGGGTGWTLTAAGEDVAFFDAMLADLSDTACVDTSRVFSTGHSFGGYMSNALACFRGNDLRAIGEVAGGPSFSFGGCTGDVAAWLAHDPTDQVVEFAQGTMARDQYVGRNGCGSTTSATTPSPCVAYDGCDAGTPVHWCDHSDGGAMGHDWPGFAGTGIWAFFASF
jgi:poly(3-hydroxybutyrate) depolymerase